VLIYSVSTPTQLIAFASEGARIARFDPFFDDSSIALPIKTH
jgi:hypothetical protein